MTILPITKDTFPLVSQFVQPYEEKCVFLTAQIRRKTDNIFCLINGSISKEKPLELKQILGVFFLESTLFHCFPNPDVLNNQEAQKLILDCVKNQKEHPLKCISGDAAVTNLLVEILKSHSGEPYQTNHYKLMTAGTVINPQEELSNDDQIIRCTQDDMELLLPIQKKYLNEEVAPFGKRASDAEVSIGLRSILKNQLCLALTSDGEVVAKANTNAIGINWVQLGGIYTHPLYRRNGYAWQLVSAICRRTNQAGKKTALFVKDINVPAMELYKKLGFQNSGLYEICYY